MNISSFTRALCRFLLGPATHTMILDFYWIIDIVVTSELGDVIVFPSLRLPWERVVTDTCQNKHHYSLFHNHQDVWSCRGSIICVETDMVRHTIPGTQQEYL